jgi:dipeptidyl aminopeptidase/acylaminoacyl peptidase
LLHGQADRFVPARQSELLAEALLRHGVPVRLQLFDGADHLWMGSEAAPREAFDLTVAFLLEHLA